VRAQLVSFVALALLVACARTGRNQPSSQLEPSGGGAGAAAGTGGAEAEVACPSPAPAFVRLSSAQLTASVRALLGDEAAELAFTELGVEGSAFPPLAQGQEGETIVDAVFERGDRMAQAVAKYVKEHFDTVVECDADYDCVEKFVTTFAERAFRRPLSEGELKGLRHVVAEGQALGAPVEQAAQYGVYAVLEAPQFLYRSELGAGSPELAADESRLTPYELASSLAFFLTGSPPDSDLLDAAQSGQLGAPEELESQIQRLLSGSTAKQHLQSALSERFKLPALASVVLDSANYPTWSLGVAGAMRSELEDLLARTLWQDPVAALLTSRAAHINEDLAEIYGVPFPAGNTVSSDGFIDVQLPETRAGLLTRAGVLALGSRPDGPSIVSRGLFVRDSIVCGSDLGDDPAPTTPVPDAATERARAELRLADAACRECHLQFDPYGMALDALDALGRYRTEDTDGTPIDPSATLPPLAGGASVDGAVELSHAIPSDAFVVCLTHQLVNYAKALPSRTEQAIGCEARAVVASLGPDANFSAILQQIAQSRSFAVRKRR
jgi:hypothetical protein